MQGIDVSRFQGAINWQRVKNAGKEFAIARAGYGRLISQKDPYFDRNYNGANEVGLPVGCYWYSYATDVAGAEAEADACLEVIAGLEFPLGVWFDQEYEPAIVALTNTQRTAIIQTFLERIKQAGFIAGLYCSADWLRTMVNYGDLTDENLWIAQYGSTLNAPLPVNLWQYSDTGRVSGIQGNVDLDQLFTPPTGGSTQGGMLPLGTETLRRGDTGVYVRNLQIILTELGYAPGTIDGIFGAFTESAVMAFQRAAGLTPDGVVVPQTRAALEQAWNQITCQQK